MSDKLDFLEVAPPVEADATVIWLHGLGDSGHGFAPIVPELKLSNTHSIRFIFPHAPMRNVTINNGLAMPAWYDIRSMELDKRADPNGVAESAQQVVELIEAEISRGIRPERIILAGFSQGGVIALHLGPRLPYQLAGIMGLSTYMSEPEKLVAEKTSANQHTPILMCHGRADEVVPFNFGQQAKMWLETAGFAVEWHDFMMQHNVCMEEIQVISTWIQKQLN